MIHRIINEKMVEENAIGVSCALTQFDEAKEVEDLIRSLPSYCSNETDLEVNKERYTKILDYYQEQPHLIDPHLSGLLEILISHILNENKNEVLISAASSFAVHLVKVRGYKIVVRHLPHEVKHVEAVLQLLELQDSQKQTNWETKYFLLLWCSILVLIPFHLSRFDSQQEGKATLMDRMLEQIKINLKRGDKCQDASAFLASKFLTRPEIVTKLMPEFLDWSMQIIVNKGKDRIDDIAKMGALKSVAYIYKHGKREDLLKYASTVLKVIQEAKLEKHANVVIQKLGVKLVQRLGLTFLKAKVASWRYQRGSRSLAMNLEEKKSGDGEKDDKDTSTTQTASNETEDDQEEYDIPDEIEEVIEYLLEGLRSIETVIRWSAAKGKYILHSFLVFIVHITYFGSSSKQHDDAADNVFCM